jgi:hypothetical protein
MGLGLLQMISGSLSLCIYLEVTGWTNSIRARDLYYDTNNNMLVVSADHGNDYLILFIKDFTLSAIPNLIAEVKSATGFSF